MWLCSIKPYSSWWFSLILYNILPHPCHSWQHQTCETIINIFCPFCASSFSGELIFHHFMRTKSTCGAQKPRSAPQRSSTSFPSADSPAELWVQRWLQGSWGWHSDSSPPSESCWCAPESGSAPCCSPGERSPLQTEKFRRESFNQVMKICTSFQTFLCGWVVMRTE